MARKATVPTEQSVSDALAMLKARILAEMAKIPALIPGTAEWMAVLERRINTAIDGSFLLQLKNELFVELPKLAQGGKGPVTRDDTDIA